MLFAALAVSRWIEAHTGWSIRKFVNTAQRYRTIEFQAGEHTPSPPGAWAGGWCELADSSPGARRGASRPNSPAASLVEIRDNLTARIAEAEQQGWLGEAEGLRVSLADAEAKLAERGRRASVINLGIPAFREIAGRTAAQPVRSSPWKLTDSPPHFMPAPPGLPAAWFTGRLHRGQGRDWPGSMKSRARRGSRARMAASSSKSQPKLIGG